MTHDLSDTLDAALDRLQAGEPLPIILACYSAEAEDLTPLLSAAASLGALQAVELPAPEVQLADRNEFLGQIAEFRGQAVSLSPLARLKGWIAHSFPWFVSQPSSSRKEQRRMSVLLAKIALVVSLAFGSTGGALAVAADSLPGSPLYPAKLGMEEMRLNLAADPADQAALQLSLAQTRAQEMEQVALAGGVPDEPTLTRLQTHLNAGLSLAAQLPDEAMHGWLIQAQQMIQAQEQALTQTQARVAGPAQEPLQQASRYLHQAGQEVEAGLQDPQTFRWRHGENRPSDVTPQPTPSPVPDPTGTPGPATPCPNGDCQPVGDQHRYGPQAEQPGPGAPGGNPDGTCTDCQPVGDENRYGPQPEQPGPGAPGGNPDGTCTDCQPAGDQNQYGPQPEQPGPGTPGGNPDGTCTDCQPAGDQNQYGPQADQPGPGAPGGNPDGTCTDCQPAGDQNQYGPQPEQPGPGAPGGNTDGTCTDCQPAGDQNQYGSQPEQSTTPSSSGGQSGSGGNGGGQSGGRH